MEQTNDNTGGRASSLAQKAVLLFCIAGTTVSVVFFMFFAPFFIDNRKNVVSVDAKFKLTSAGADLNEEASGRNKSAEAFFSAGGCKTVATDPANRSFSIQCVAVLRDKSGFDKSLNSSNGKSAPEIITDTKVESLNTLVTLLFSSFINEKTKR